MSRPPCARDLRLAAADAVDEDLGEEPEPEGIDERAECERLCLWLETGQADLWYSAR